MSASTRLRENIQQTMAQSASDLDSQKNATEFAMRKRIHETEQAKTELLWQKKNVNIVCFSSIFLLLFPSVSKRFTFEDYLLFFKTVYL